MATQGKQPDTYAVTGLAALRSVCRAWRAAAGPAPCLLLPRVRASHRIVFPLSRGWSLVLDTRDASCHVSHLATHATAALPKLNAVRDDPGSDVVRHVRYVHCNDLDTAVRSNWMFPTYLEFTDYLRFAVHLPPGAPAAGMTVMMYHVMHGHTGMLFCRPGDAAWTKVEKPRRIGYGYFDFAYHDGKMFGLDTGGGMAVFDAATLGALHLVRRPPDMLNLCKKMYGHGSFPRKKEFDYVHLVSLPSKLVLVVVRTTVKSSRPVAFDLFELGSSPAPDGQLAWRKVAEAGNYELFIDRYHAAFWENDGANEGGTRIYYVHDEQKVSTVAAYCYSMHDNKLECVYKSSPKDDAPLGCLTRPSWFVP